MKISPIWLNLNREKALSDLRALEVVEPVAAEDIKNTVHNAPKGPKNDFKIIFGCYQYTEGKYL